MYLLGRYFPETSVNFCVFIISQFLDLEYPKWEKSIRREEKNLPGETYFLCRRHLRFGKNIAFGPEKAGAQGFMQQTGSRKNKKAGIPEIRYLCFVCRFYLII
jgi:hypothetical protein